MKPYLLALVACLGVWGCTSGPASPTPETPPKAIRTVGYDINIPYVAVVMVYRMAYPDGFRGTPLEAQTRFDYTSAYHGSPNVYYGEIAPGVCQYQMTGILVAPQTVAGMVQFTSKDWPVLEPGYTYTWRGNFVVALVGNPSPEAPNPAPSCR